MGVMKIEPKQLVLNETQVVKPKKSGRGKIVKEILQLKSSVDYIEHN